MLIVSLVLLVVGANWLVDGSAAIAEPPKQRITGLFSYKVKSSLLNSSIVTFSIRTPLFYTDFAT